MRPTLDGCLAPTESSGGRRLRKQGGGRRTTSLYPGRRTMPEVFNSGDQADAKQETEAQRVLRVLSRVSESDMQDHLHGGRSQTIRRAKPVIAVNRSRKRWC